MSIVRCEKGQHLFNSEIHAFCPDCGSVSSTIILPNAAESNESHSSGTSSDTEVSQFGFRDVNVTIDSNDFKKGGITQEVSQWLSQKYRLIAPLSSGGMGRIFVAQEVLSGRYVALKILLDKSAKEDSIVQQFVREAVITARLQHPNIIPVHDLGFFSEGKLYYTMRFVEGRKFSEIIEKADFDLTEKIRILRCVAQAVFHAHDKGLWHRDLKPENVLIGSLGDTYVIDWGLVSLRPGRAYKLNLPRIIIENQSYYVPEPDRLIERTRGAITETGHIIGTPAYMSPEQFAGQYMTYDNGYDSGISSDIWAIGIMLYQSLCNVHPLRDHHLMEPLEIAFKLSRDPFPQIVVDEKYSSLVELCNNMLAKDPHNRLKSLADFILETAKFFSNMGPTSTIVYMNNESNLGSSVPHLDEIQRHQFNQLKQREEIWAELANLNVFAFRRRKVLMNKLLKLSPS